MTATWKPAALRAQEIQQIQNTLPKHIECLQWSRQQIEAAQTQGLRDIIAHAKQYSSWHKNRLAHIDAATLTPADISKLPIMTKSDVMANWDNIVTDQTLTLAKANAFLDGLQPECFEFYDNRYHIYTTGGSSGVRGVFAWNLADSIDCAMTFFRYQYRDEFAKDKTPAIVAVLVANHPVHKSTPIFSVAFTPTMQTHCIYSTWPIKKKIEHLTTLQPTHLVGYTSVIYELAQYALKKQLNIKPKRISVSSEPLSPAMRETILKAWPVPISNVWGGTECGVCASTCDFTDNLHLTEDKLLLEFVDEKNQAVPVGTQCSKILVTVFYNRTMPIIRYQIDDQATILSERCSCGADYRLITQIIGRNDDEFIYPQNIKIPGEIFEVTLSAFSNIIDYQVFQTTNGANIFIISSHSTFDPAILINKITEAYVLAGMKNPAIKVELVEKLQRHPVTGKLRQCVPFKSN